MCVLYGQKEANFGEAQVNLYVEEVDLYIKVQLNWPWI